MSVDVWTAFDEYLAADKGAAARRNLQQAIAETPGFNRRTPWLVRAQALLAQDRADELIRLINAQMPGAFLCPDAHLMLSRALTRIHRTPASDRESFLAATALEFILDTGSGTEAKPWQVLRIADEYAVLAHLGLSPQCQTAHHDEGGVVDAIECSDGTERWFALV